MSVNRTNKRPNPIAIPSSRFFIIDPPGRRSPDAELRAERHLRSVKVDGTAIGSQFERLLPLAIMLGEPATFVAVVGDMGHRDRRMVGKVLGELRRHTWSDHALVVGEIDQLNEGPFGTRSPHLLGSRAEHEPREGVSPEAKSGRRTGFEVK